MPVSLRATTFSKGLRLGLWFAFTLTRADAQTAVVAAANHELQVRRGAIAAGAVRMGGSRPVMAPPRTGGSGVVAVPLAEGDALAALAGRAGVIFAGHVLLITRNDAAGYVDVRFHIDQAIRGCAATSSYVLREWAGLWTGRAPRYRAGESLLLLLTARGPSGMSAPVGGAEMSGAIPIVAGLLPPLVHGTAVAPPERGGRETASSVDLRWLQAHAVRNGPHGLPIRLHPLGVARAPETAANVEVESFSVSTGAERSGAALPPFMPPSALGSGASRLGEQPTLEAVLLLLRGLGGANDARH